jgi:hypothetical protein
MDCEDQDQLTDTLVAMARYLDDDHLQTAVMAMCRDADAVPMIFWRKEVLADAGSDFSELWDPHQMFVLLHGEPYEAAHKKMLAAMTEKRTSLEVAKAVERAFETGQSQTVSVPRLEVRELGDGGVVETKDD